MDAADILNPNPCPRTEDQRRAILRDLVHALSSHTSLEFTPTVWWADDSSNFVVNMRSPVSSFAAIETCGVISVSINPGEFAGCIAEFLLFSNGKRITGPLQSDVLRFKLRLEGWSSGEWIVDVNGEWEMHDTPGDQRWQNT